MITTRMPRVLQRGFDLAAFLEQCALRAEEREGSAFDLESVLRGTRNVAFATVGGVSLPVRALSPAEGGEVLQRARDSAGVRGAPIDDTSELVVSLVLRHSLAIATLDPIALDNGERVPLLRFAQLSSFTRAAIDALLVAFDRATGAAFPLVDSRQAVHELVEALRARARTHVLDRIRAQHSEPDEFFGVSPIELTPWQITYFRALGAT